MKTSAVVMIAASLLTGCVSLSKKASEVQLHRQSSNFLDGCKKLGIVTASASRMLGEFAIQEASSKLRENAADVGGNAVVFLNSDHLLTEVVLQGIAFKCDGSSASLDAGRSVRNSSGGHALQPNLYGPGVHGGLGGRPVTLEPQGGARSGETLRVQPNAYGPGVHMDQYGRPVRERDWAR